MKLSLGGLTNKEKILPGVQYLRGICALAVVLCHYSSDGFGPEWQKAMTTMAFTGVYVFFFVSGFINVYAMRLRRYRVGQFFTFILKRLIRFDPPYYLVILLTLSLFNLLALVPSFKGAAMPLVPGQLLANLFYFAPLTGYPFYSSVFWSLCVEFQFYLLLGLVYFLSDHKAYRLGFLFIFTGLSFCSGLGGFYSVLRYAPLFSFGISLIPFYLKNTRANLIAPIVLLMVIIVQFGWLTAWILLLAALIAVFYRGNIPLLFFMGDISYSLYLSHSLTLILTRGLLRHFWPSLLTRSLPVLLLQIMIAIGLAYLLYCWVERPASRLAKRISYRGDR